MTPHDLLERLRDRHAAKETRLRALLELSALDTPCSHEELIRLLADRTEPTWLRAEAAEKIGGHNVFQARDLLEQILGEQENEPAQVLFWCLYACHAFEPDRELEFIVMAYLDDQREVDPEMFGLVKGKATLAMEARWVIEHWQGLGTDPEWMKT